MAHALRWPHLTCSELVTDPRPERPEDRDYVALATVDPGAAADLADLDGSVLVGADAVDHAVAMFPETPPDHPCQAGKWAHRTASPNQIPARAGAARRCRSASPAPSLLQIVTARGAALPLKGCALAPKHN